MAGWNNITTLHIVNNERIVIILSLFPKQKRLNAEVQKLHTISPGFLDTKTIKW